MPDFSKEPARVTRARAMELLCIDDDRTFRKVIDANPQIAHRLPGETRAKYLTSELARLLKPRCATEGEEKDRGRKADARGLPKSKRTS